MPTTAITSTQILDSGLTGRELIQAADQAAAQAIIGVDPSQYGLLSANNTWTGFNTFQDDLITSFISSASIDATGSISVSEDLEVQGGMVANAAEFSGEVEFTNLITGVGGEHQGDLTISQNADMIVTGGGGYKLYNIGTEGDVDTEYLGLTWSANLAKVEPLATGSGVVRDFQLGTAATKVLIRPQSNQVWLYSNSIARLLCSSGGVGIGGTLYPFSDNTYDNGTTANRWANVYSVDGNFSGTVTTDAIQSTSTAYVTPPQVYFSGSGGFLAGSNSNTALRWTDSSVQIRQDMTPKANGTLTCGTDTFRWSTVASVDGSFSGNLVSEVGGSYRLYNLGTEGDIDTQYFEFATVGSDFYFQSQSTGTGVDRAIYLAAGDNPNIYLSSSDVRFFKNIRPQVTGTTELGNATYRWSTVGAVDGDFSGTVTALNVTGVNNLYLQNSVDTASMSLAGSGGVTIRAHNAIMQQFTPTGVNYRVDCIPTFDGNTNLGLTTNRWGNVYSVNGSFSGNLNTEVGGTYKLYNLGTEGDTDTEYLEIEGDTSIGYYKIQPKYTGAGSALQTLRILAVDGSHISLYAGGQFAYTKTGIQHFYCDNNGVRITDLEVSGTVSTDELLVGVTASTTGAYDSEIHNRLLFQSLSSRAFTARNPNTLADVFNINTSQSIVTVANDLVVGNNGSFSGNLNTEVGGSLSMFSLGTDGDTDTESLDIEFDSLNSKWEISTNQTGSGLLRQLWFDASQYRMYESGTLLWIGEANEMRMYGAIVPSSDGNKSVGIASKRFGNIYAVDGDFSGTVTTPSVFNSNGGTGITINANDIRFSRNGLGQRMLMESTNLRSVTDGDMHLGTSSFRWGNTYSVDGSFSGNLNTEVGGSQRVYNLGAEGDVDTEYLETYYDSANTRFYIRPSATGAGVVQKTYLGDDRTFWQTDPATNTLLARCNNSNRLYLTATDARVFTDFTPNVDGVNACGTSVRRWSNVASVDGDFSGRVLTTRLENLDGLSYIRVSGGTTSPIKLWRNTAPQGNNAFDMGADAERFRTVYSVDGSFSGNLVSEAGGTYKLYNLGAEGDADTEYLEMAWTGSGATSKGIISVGSTGAGASRELILAGNSFRIRGAGGVGDRFYVDANSILFQIDGKVSNGVNFRPTTVTASNTSDLGLSAYRWRNIFGVNGDFSGTVTAVDGSFSGNLNTEVGGSPRIYNLGTDGDTDTEYLDISWQANNCKFKSQSTGAGVERRLDFEGSGIRYIAAGITVADISAGDIRLYSGRTIRPLLDNDASVGKTGQRFTNVYSYAGDFAGTITNSATTSWSATFSRAIRVGADSGIGWYYGNGNMTKFNTPVTFESSFQFARPADGIASRLYRMSKTASSFTCVPVDGGVSGDTIFQVEDATNTFQPLRTGGIVSHYPDNSGAQAYRMYNLGEVGDADTEYGFIKWDSGTFQIGVDATGSGSNSRPVSFYTNSSFGFKAVGGSTRFNITASAVTTYLSFMPNQDKARNLGSTTSKFARCYVNGGMFSDVETVTASTKSLVTTDSTILCDCTSNTIAIDIPTSSVQEGNRYEIKKIDSSANAVTITPTSRTIDGAASITLTSQFQSITLVSDGTNWFIV